MKKTVLVACQKGQQKCTARATHGSELYEVSVRDVCEDQISAENREY